MSTTLLPDAPVPALSDRAPRRRTRSVVAALAGVLAVLLAVALPFAPVVADRTTVTWPAQGEQPTSTTALFVPYRPAELRAEIPCTAVQTALADGERTTLLATNLVRDQGSATGLVVDTDAGQLRVLVNGRLVQAAAPDPTGCDVRVDADDTALTVAVGSGAPIVLAGEPVPEVFAFTTDLTPEEADGTTVTARTRTWFESTPSVAKTAMTGGHVVLVALSLLLLARWVVRPARRAEAHPAGRVPGRVFALACDAAVLGALSLWIVIAPNTDDDGYASMTIRNGLTSGDIGNYYHWFNASEAPFTFVQHIVQPLATLSAAPLWLRLPSYLAGVLTWFAVSRGVLPVVLPRSVRGRLATVLAAVCFLAWWLPFNTGVRPEPWVALGSVTVLALLLRGTAPTARRPLLLIGAAALVAGVCLSVTPSGVIALAPVLVLLPRIWRTVRGVDDVPRSSWWTTAGVATLLAGLASSGLVVMFADQSWHGVAKATELHTAIGPNLHWYEESTRYGFLLGGGAQGTATKRLAVLLTIAVLLLVVPLLARRLPTLREFPAVHLLTGSMALTFALLFITPSKWSHHFGSLAGLGASFLTMACLVLLQVVRSRTRDRVTVVVALAGAGIVALFVGLSFSGTNSWYLYSNLGVPWNDVAVSPFGVPLGNPATWLVLAAAATAAVHLVWSRRSGGGGVAVLAAAPALITVGAVAASVAVLLVGFTVAPLRQAQAGSYSLAATNLGTLTGVSCGIPEDVDVLLDDPDGALPPASPDEPTDGETADGFVADAGYLPSSPPPGTPGTGPVSYTWGSLVGGESATGTLVSRWFTLPDLADGQDVAVTASGRTGGANRLELEFGRAGEGTDVLPLTRRAVDDGQADQPAWRPLAVAAGDVPDGADRVRVLATDASTDVGGWLAVTGPRVRTSENLQNWLAARGPVLPDWPLSWHVPCVENVPVVADGLAQTPTVILAAPGGYAGPAAIAYLPEQGGSFAGVSLATPREVPSRLAGGEAEEWGRVVELDYPLARDQYDRATDEVTLWGWQGDR